MTVAADRRMVAHLTSQTAPQLCMAQVMLFVQSLYSTSSSTSCLVKMSREAVQVDLIILCILFEHCNLEGHCHSSILQLQGRSAACKATRAASWAFPLHGGAQSMVIALLACHGLQHHRLDCASCDSCCRISGTHFTRHEGSWRLPRGTSSLHSRQRSRRSWLGGRQTL